MHAASLALVAFAFPSVAQSLGKHESSDLLTSEGSRAPLVLFINGPGRVLPFHDGQMLQVGPEYRMQAIPERGAVFAGWNQVNVFVFRITTIDGSGNPTVVTSTNFSPIPISVESHTLRFTVQPPAILESGFTTITGMQAWQANFVPR
jgi:hypothetical protein